MNQPHTQPIRVLWLIKGLGPGGAEQLLLLSAKVANRTDFAHRLIYVRPDKTHLVPEFEALGLTPERIGPGPLNTLRDLRQALAESDVVHAHSPVLAVAARLLARTLPRKRRPAVVTTEHNEWTSHRAPTRILNGLTTSLDAHHWAVSDQVRDTMWARHRRRYEVLIHGIDTNAALQADEAQTARSRLRAELGISDDHVLALTVANLRHNKDYPNLLNAAKLALAESPRLTFASVGQGPLVEEINALHDELGLGESFRLLGFRRDIGDLMAAADIFVLASAHEGLPVAVMEAFAAGLPVVATNVGGLSQQVRTGVEGLLVPAGNPLALAEALVKVASDDALRASMSTAAKARADDYDIRAAVTTQEAVYRDLANG
jgi:glycosyltransferase involved in cell wall biosynthesis